MITKVEIRVRNKRPPSESSPLALNDILDRAGLDYNKDSGKYEGTHAPDSVDWGDLIEVLEKVNVSGYQITIERNWG
jgi:hypothetical protein